MEKKRISWWSRWDSNPRLPRCHRGALPTAPRPHRSTDAIMLASARIVRPYECGPGLRKVLVKNTNVFPYPLQSKFLGILLLAFMFLAFATSLSSQDHNHSITHPSVAKIIPSL